MLLKFFHIFLWLWAVGFFSISSFLLLKGVKKASIFGRLLYGVPTWIIYIFLILLPLVVVGAVLIPIAAAFKAYAVVPSTVNDQYPIYHFTWKLMFLWDNDDDGIVDPGYSSYKSMFMRIFYWSAVRNPVNNIKHIPLICCKVDTEKVRFVGSLINCTTKGAYNGLTGPGFSDFLSSKKSLVNQYDTKIPQWWFCWNGFYSNFYVTVNISGHLWLCWVGHKIKPTAIYGVQSYLLPYAPCGAQVNKET